jgi:GNAT superfamily N-acetyltransferase
MSAAYGAGVIEIRRLSASDDAAYAGKIVQDAYFSLPDYPRDDEYDHELGSVGRRADDAVVAILDGRIVGCLTFVSGVDSEHDEFGDPEAASFRFFGVDPAMQGRKVGEAMVAWCLEEAKRLGRRRIRIHTLESMPGAQRLYLRLGFVRTPEFDRDWDGIIGLAFAFSLDV